MTCEANLVDTPWAKSLSAAGDGTDMHARDTMDSAVLEVVEVRDLCVDMCAGMCMGMHIDTDMCVDMCVGMWCIYACV